MATQDNNLGLFSKVAKFVRNPTTDWADLEKPGPEPESQPGYNKQALKNMIERKRHDDTIRKREFDQLRKLRRKFAVVTPDMAEKTSFFRGSTGYSDLDERAVTLKKIDEIEAQMSKQWWKGHQGANPGATPAAPQTSSAGLTQAADKHVFDTKSTFASTLVVYDRSDSDDAPTLMGFTNAPESALGASVHANSQDGPAPSPRAAELGGLISSTLFAPATDNDLAEPELEEAAIRFANGDDAGAESVLLSALQGDQVPDARAEVWISALFDLYRCTGQHERFESLELDFAQRHGRIAPTWFSTPEILALNQPRAACVAPTAAPAEPVIWACPVTLDDMALVPLQLDALAQGRVMSLNWRRLQRITAPGAALLAKLVSKWCGEPVALHMEGEAALLQVLRDATPAGNTGTAKVWWQLRLDCLRLLRMQDDFELAALDFCITYEVSPPPWQDARCKRLYQLPGGTPGMGENPLLDPNLGNEWGSSRGFPPSVLQAPCVMPGDLVELSGALVGDAANLLVSLETAAKKKQRIVISCARLIRADFSAAGSILNWAANGEDLGCQIEFHDVPVLVAAFFNVIGINQHASILIRKT